MSALMPAYGWAGSVDQFLNTGLRTWKQHLSDHLLGTLGFNPAGTQAVAWDEEFEAIRAALSNINVDTAKWKVVFEFELPLEGGRRPDVIIHTGDVIFVIEFKTAHQPRQPFIDQARAYAMDLSSYHQASHGLVVIPIVAISGANAYEDVADGVYLASFDRLGEILEQHAGTGDVDLDVWLNSPYAPLPTLIAAAKRIFNHEEVPNVFAHQSAGIPNTLDLIAKLVHEAKEDGTRKLIFVTGVPGSGKTLVGLRLVYERSIGEEPATFLSGNGPLVKVLQEVLKSRAFIRDLHRFIKTNSLQGKMPLEHVIVFDEAQRACDREYMLKKRGVAHSEPELLVQVGEKLEGWAVLIGLVGEGQEIFSGEEAGMTQWQDAVKAGNQHWVVHGSPELEHMFGEVDFQTHDTLNLSTSLRSRRAADLHEWVRLVVEGSVTLAARLAMNIHAAGFDMYLTRDVDHARHYVRERYAGAADKRYGLLAPSGTKKSLLLHYGIDNTFLGERKVKVGKWYTADEEDLMSSNGLSTAITEFSCRSGTRHAHSLLERRQAVGWNAVGAPPPAPSTSPDRSGTDPKECLSGAAYAWPRRFCDFRAA